MIIVVLLQAACTTSAEDDRASTSEATPTFVPETPTPEQLGSINNESGKDSTFSFDSAFLEQVNDAVKAQANVPFHFDLNAKILANFSGIPVTGEAVLEGDYLPPNKSQANLSVNLGFVDFETETVVVGETIYSQEPTTQRWQKIESETTIMSGPVQAIFPALSMVTNFLLIGEETLGTISVIHLRVENVPGLLGKIDENATVDVWLESDTLRIVKMELRGNVLLGDLGQQFKDVGSSGLSQLEITMWITDYGKEASIVVPHVPTGVDGSVRTGTFVPELKSFHIGFGESHPDYNSVPGTSGWHYGSPHAPIPWGVYREFISDEVLIHNLEHAGIGIHYDCPDRCPELVRQLEAFARQYQKIVVSPYPDMERRIALTAWTFIDKFDDYDEERISDFIEDHINSSEAPEPFAP